RSLVVTDSGPVSFVRVSFRITAPDTSALAVSLVSPKGTEVPLVVNRGTGADFGSGGKTCGGYLTAVDFDKTDSTSASADSLVIETPYRPEGKLTSLYGQDARGRWTLHITNAGRPARLQCFTLDISRDIPQTLKASKGKIAATLTFTERNFQFDKLRV